MDLCRKLADIKIPRTLVHALRCQMQLVQRQKKASNFSTDHLLALGILSVIFIACARITPLKKLC